MRRMLLGIAALIVVATIAGDRPSQARWFAPGAYGTGLGYGLGGGYGGGWGGWGGGWGGAMYGGVAANNMQAYSQLIRANGQWKIDNSEAAIKYEDARTKYIDNKEKWVKTWQEMQTMYETHKAEEMEKRKHSPEVLAAAAKSGRPTPLSAESLDPISGKINWPEALQASDYDGPRQSLDQLFELRSQAGGSGTSIRISEATQQMFEILKGNITSLPTGEYLAARRFLESLAYAARSS